MEKEWTYKEKEIEELKHKYDMLDEEKSYGEKITLELLHQMKKELENKQKQQNKKKR